MTCSTRWRVPPPKCGERMAVHLNKRAYEYARRLIEQGRFVADDRDL